MLLSFDTAFAAKTHWNVIEGFLLTNQSMEQKFRSDYID